MLVHGFRVSGLVCYKEKRILCQRGEEGKKKNINKRAFLFICTMRHTEKKQHSVYDFSETQGLDAEFV